MKNSSPTICVVGSSNIDQIAYTDRVPDSGETLIGKSFQMGFGGKGANQAVMAGILGANTYMITCLGDDAYADMTIENYKKSNVNIDYIQRVPGSSGVAPIWVEKDGTNRIIVISGANNLLDADKAITGISSIENLTVVVGQFEIPQNVTFKVFDYCKSKDIQTILNPAPAQELDESLLEVSDWFIPNEVEFNIISKGGDSSNDKDITRFSSEIKSNLIITLGEDGAVTVEGNDVVRVPAPNVKAIDTTGAGDAFVGAFAYGIGSGLTKMEALQLGIDKASDSVTRNGTQSSFK
jgi:ribokinase